MLANISAIEARVGGGASDVVFTRGSDTPDMGMVVDAGGIDDDGALVEAAESMGSEAADTRLVWRLALLHSTYGGEWMGWFWRWRRLGAVAALGQARRRERERERES
jgi:hypothetical protein